MSEQVNEQETVVRFRDDTEVATVEAWDNGLRVMSKKVSIENIVVNLLDMVETQDVVELLGRNGFLEEGMEKIIDEYTGLAPATALSIYINRVNREEDMQLVASLFKAIVEKFDMSKVDPQSMAKIMELMLHRIGRVDDAAVNGAYQELFIELLKKVQIALASHTLVSRVLKELLTKALTEQDVETVESMFEVLAAKARPHWIQKVLAPHVSKQKVIVTPILPKNTVFYQQQLDGTHIVCLEVERQRINTIYRKEKFASVGHPKMLFVFSVSGENITNCKVYAVKDLRLSKETELYRFPFSNVNDNFSACWPDLNSFQLKEIAQLETLPLFFLESPSNDHLYRGRELKEVFAALENKDFDNSLLERTGLTFGTYFGIGPEAKPEPDDRITDDEDDIEMDELDEVNEFEDFDTE
ncbi:hypothetical protein [Brevibacillus centrosporus]|uniref:hypothetical protein n=1 Tax=Brevibacillus centrosporus TaxID=54910 RepID=UPI003987A105